FGGVIGLMLTWFAALLGPIATAMILGLLPAFKRGTSVTGILSSLGGIAAFANLKVVADVRSSIGMSGPGVSSLVIYIGYSLLNRTKTEPEVENMLEALNDD